MEEEGESEELEEESEEEEEEEEDEDESSGRKRSKLSSSLQKRDYFSFRSEKNRTSNNTLNSISILDKKQILSIVSKLPEKHLQEKQQLKQEIEKEFPKWFFEFENGFNILVYGAGSKKWILETFSQKILLNHLCLVIQGYIPTLSIRNILNTITKQIFHHENPFSSFEKQCEFIANGFTHPEQFEDGVPPRLFLIIHNIDGVPLRNSKHQTILSILASIPQIKIIASIDHINAAQLWDNTMKMRFNWVWHEVNLYERYIEETKYDQSLLGSSIGGDIAASGLRFVLRSLTQNSREMFRILAEYQLANSKENGMNYRQFYEKCREQFLVVSEETMRTQLTEFRDHNIILTKTGKNGGNFFIPIIPAIIKQTLEDTSLFPPKSKT